MTTPLLRDLEHLSRPHGGCIPLSALHQAGHSDRHVQSLVARGALTMVLPRMYLYGASALSNSALLWAACLRAGEQARLAERTALAVHGLVSADPSTVTVWVPRRATTTATTVRMKTLIPLFGTGEPATLEIRARRRLGEREQVGVLPVSVPIDALVGLASRGHSWELSKAWRESDFKGLLSVDRVESRLGRGIEGSTVIRELMERHPIVGTDVTFLSRAERRLFAGITRRGFPTPAVNRPIEFGRAVLRPDIFFFLEQLAVEVNGAGHDSPARQLEDVARIRAMRDAGVEVLEFGDDEVHRNLEACLDLIGARLVARRRELRAD
jgi:very-short-patch-repair endonuclease